MLKKLVFKRHKHTYVDIDFLKESYTNGRLIGANVFARIFGLIEDDLFKFSSKNMLNLSSYDIYLEDWVLLLSFIRTGYIQSFSNSVEENLKQLDDCYDICLKLGGVPEFETYCNLCYDWCNSITLATYNPMTPQEDVNNLYSWRIVSMLGFLEKNESVTLCIAYTPVLAFYARKKINIYEQSS